MRAPDESPFAASTGQTATRADWLDLHFESALPEYTQAVKMVGLERGWHLLDAGCGAGSFLPLLAPEVGPDGRITALDLAPENIEVVRSKLASSPLECPIEALVGSLDSLPFPDDTFDAAWIANVLMYFEDEDLPGVIAELERVVRPGGLVAAKESDGRMMTVGPVPLELLRELSPLTPLPPRIAGIHRSRENVHWFRNAGLDDVWQKTIVQERNSPLGGPDYRYMAQQIQSMSSIRLGVDSTLTNAARDFLNAQLDPDSEEALVNHPRFTSCGGSVVTVGRVSA